MTYSISSKELGERIASVRSSQGLSQEELSQRIGLSRPSFTQLELGNRKLSVPELQRLAQELQFSLDEFLARDFDLSEVEKHSKLPDISVVEERVSEPEFNIDKFKNVLLYILERCAGKPNVGETLLYKLLYFADFDYYELYEEHLTGVHYRKLPFGPVPRNIRELLGSMLVGAASLKRIKTEYHGYPQTRYLPLMKSDLKKLKASEKEVLDQVIARFSDWSATAVSDYSHRDIPWLVTKEGENINYELALYREAPHSVRNYEES